MTVVSWFQDTTGGLLTLCAIAVAVLLFLIIKVKLEPFIALVLVGLGLGLAAGLSVTELVGTALKSGDSLLETGFGGILGHIAVIIGLGTVLGAILERSGGADTLTNVLMRLFGEKRAPIAMGLLGLIVGIPVFFDIGIFVLAPLVYVTALRGRRSLVLYALPMLAGLSMTHAFLPPHPGPVALAGLLGVDLGYLIMMGLVCGLPGFVAAGLVWGTWIGKRVMVEVPADFIVGEMEHGLADKTPGESGAAGGSGSGTVPGSGGGGGGVARTAVESKVELGVDGPKMPLVAFVIATPLVLILGATFGTMLLPAESGLLPWLTFFGNPAVALLIAVLLSFYFLGVRRGMSVASLGKLTGESLRPIGMILLVVGAGAFFGKVISATGIGAALAETLSAWGLPVIVLAYVLSCGLRIAQGSATVAIVTTGGIVGPLVATAGYSQIQLALIAMAIAAGSIICSHVNDGGFWIIAKYFNMTVKQTLQTWTVLETVLSVVSFAVAGTLFAVI
ncbi:GntP family permease [Nakamurella sp.]|uniref:GntP family permease n=1 Tax=Nakamurella sp. TaxID=1869182 RepID=UPI0037837165